MTSQLKPLTGTTMCSEKETRYRRHDSEQGADEADKPLRRPRIDGGERDEYDEWRRDRSNRGRKRRDKAGGRHRSRSEDKY